MPVAGELDSERIPVVVSKLAPAGSVPVSVSVGVGEPAVTTWKVPPVPSVKLAWAAEVIAGNPAGRLTSAAPVPQSPVLASDGAHSPATHIAPAVDGSGAAAE